MIAIERLKRKKEGGSASWRTRSHLAPFRTPLDPIMLGTVITEIFTGRLNCILFILHGKRKKEGGSAPSSDLP
ncbi:hypothetical protein, partial [Candidatus Magnetobacterium casense]|uniref:hypothetical protein n=1 Tax=Candidatus Magnetobacterium casense TaxID=1455061 RepID=UPI001C4413E7